MRVGMLVTETSAMRIMGLVGLRVPVSVLGACARDFAPTKYFDPPHRSCINI